MTPEQSRLLKIGHHVANKKSVDLPGTVVRITSGGVQIKWNEGKITDHGHDEMRDIRVAE